MSTSTASKLETLVGLGSAKRLVKRLAQGELGTHAVLLYGVPGSGKHVLAHLLAQAWLCQQPGLDGADGTCKACGSFERGNNADFLLITPQGASRNILVRQISNDNPKDDDPTPLLSFFRTMPIASRHKVGLIEDAHRMNDSSSNSLLKTLEEPLPHAKLILTTDSIGGVRPTILSRCLAVACELPDAEELRKLAPTASPDLIRLSEGAPGRIQAATKKPQNYERLAEFARKLATLPPGAALAAADSFREIGDALAKQNDSGARAGNALALELLATFLAREDSVPPSWTQMTVEAHRRIIGNCSATVVFDALFAEMLAR